MKMSPPPKEDTFYNFFKAKYTTRYLENYVDEHVYDGKTLRDRMVLEFAVQTVKKEGALWVIRGDQLVYRAPKLIVATGITLSANYLKFGEWRMRRCQSFIKEALVNRPSSPRINIRR